MNPPLRRIAPMKAVARELPRSPGWTHELKWDGMRAICTVHDDTVEAHSSNLIDITARFPELGRLALPYSGHTVVFDGELVALDGGRPSFSRLQRRMHLDSRDVGARAAEIPVVFVIFDLLRLDDHETLALGYRQRRQLLENLFEPGPTWRLTDTHDGDPMALLDVVTDHELEGIISKRDDSTYHEGRRSPDWVKTKPRRRQELVVGGWSSGEGARQGRIGSLIVGYHDDEGLRFAGRVGSGLTDVEAARIAALGAPLAAETSPFIDPVAPEAGREITWLRPELVVEVAFAHWTDDDRLRHPVYLGQRVDVPAATIGREP